MSVEPSTSVKSGLNVDNDFIETSTTIDEQEFRSHPTKKLKSDIQVCVKDEEMKEESIKAPHKCPMCEKVFVTYKDYTNHVWPVHLEESGYKYTQSRPPKPMFEIGDVHNLLPRKFRILSLFGAKPNEEKE